MGKCESYPSSSMGHCYDRAVAASCASALPPSDPGNALKRNPRKGASPENTTNLTSLYVKGLPANDGIDRRPIARICTIRDGLARTSHQQLALTTRDWLCQANQRLPGFQRASGRCWRFQFNCDNTLPCDGFPARKRQMPVAISKISAKATMSANTLHPC